MPLLTSGTFNPAEDIRFDRQTAIWDRCYARSQDIRGYQDLLLDSRDDNDTAGYFNPSLHGFVVPQGQDGTHIILLAGLWARELIDNRIIELNILIDGVVTGGMGGVSVLNSDRQWQRVRVKRNLSAGQVVTFQARHAALRFLTLILPFALIVKGAAND